MPWKLTVRAASRIQRESFADLDQALDVAERRARELAESPSRKPVDVPLGRFDAVQQVAARIELAGPERLFPSLCGGLDIRGDGSAEAYRGRIRREAIQPRAGESVYAALRRALTQD